jgi:phosphatidylserine decarboxylase
MKRYIGDELGQFRLGSTVILLFQPNKVNWLESISAQKVVRLGEKLADF